jgi:hypothetical protein
MLAQQRHALLRDVPLDVAAIAADICVRSDILQRPGRVDLPVIRVSFNEIPLGAVAAQARLEGHARMLALRC